jgi:C4-dicarboxylate-specific signal transduction histidine kinase
MPFPAGEGQMLPMEPAEDPLTPSSAGMHRLARLLRHEVGDLLQSVYSTVGILIERLPAGLDLERRLVADLKNRAELCKIELDSVVELVAPLVGAPTRVDLSGTVNAALQQLRRRFPAVQVSFEEGPRTYVQSAPLRLSGALGLLFQAVGQGAQRQVTLSLTHRDAHAELLIQRDGYAVTAEQLAWLTEPFASTQHALFGLGLALAQRAVTPAGGTVSAANRDQGGVAVRVTFPLAPDA